MSAAEPESTPHEATPSPAEDWTEARRQMEAELLRRRRQLRRWRLLAGLMTLALALAAGLGGWLHERRLSDEARATAALKRSVGDTGAKLAQAQALLEKLQAAVRENAGRSAHDKEELARLRGESQSAAARTSQTLAQIRGLQEAARQAEETAKQTGERYRKLQAQSEDLVSAMLLELHDQLKPLGRLDILFGASRKALEFLGAATWDQGDAAAERSRAAALTNIGDVLLAQGSAPAALQAYRKGLEIRTRLAEKKPGEAALRREVATSQEKVGEALLAQGNAAGALEAYGQSLKISRELAGRAPQDAERQRELARDLDKLGDIHLAQGNAPAALGVFRESLDILSKLAGQAPSVESARELSVGHEKVGKTLLAQGDTTAALESYRKSLEIRMKLGESPQRAAR